MGRRKVIYISILISFAAIYIIGFRSIGNWLMKEDIPVHADASVLLMGSFPERVLQAADLYHQGVADNMIIVYESMGPYQLLEARGAGVIRTTEQARDAAVALGIPDSCITMLPGNARSTLDEALAVRDYMAGKPWIDTLVLVSSAAHIRRAYMIFNAALRDAETPVYVGCSPSAYSSFNPDKWWRRKEDIQQVLSELVKIVSFRLVEQKNLKN